MKVIQIVLAVLLVILFGLSVPVLQAMGPRQEENPNYPRLTDLFPEVPLWCIFCIATRYGSLYLLWDAYKAVVEIHDKKLNQRITKFGFSVWKICYYCFTSWYSYTNLLTKTWLPTYLGGRNPIVVGSFLICYPHCDEGPHAMFMYKFQMGFALHTTICHFLDVWRRDFWEMLIHHVVLCALLFLSYCRNWIAMGILILWIHDVSDIGIYLMKMFVEVGWDTGTIISLFYWSCTWLYLRCYALPFRLLLHDWPIRAIYDRPEGMTFEEWPFTPENYYPDSYIFWGLLWLLVVLHYWWAYLVIKGFGGMLLGKRGADLANIISDKDVEKKKKRS